MTNIIHILLIYREAIKKTALYISLCSILVFGSLVTLDPILQFLWHSSLFCGFFVFFNTAFGAQLFALMLCEHLVLKVVVIICAKSEKDLFFLFAPLFVSLLPC